jgi:protein TonB
MFESTLEAQGLGDPDRKLGTLSAAAVAHLAFGLAIVAVTALIVPKANVPEPPRDPFPVVAVIPLAPVRANPAPAPKPPKGTGATRPGRNVVPPPVVPDVPLVATPDLLPSDDVDTSSDGPDASGEGLEGDRNGSSSAGPGGLGDGDEGAGLEHGVGPVEVTGDMTRPVLLVKVEPSYPPVPRRAGLGGRVTLRAVIAEDGNVESVEVLASTNRLFDDAAVDAVRQWRYRPAVMNGRPVRVFLSVVVDFHVR